MYQTQIQCACGMLVQTFLPRQKKKNELVHAMDVSISHNFPGRSHRRKLGVTIHALLEPWLRMVINEISLGQSIRS